MFKYSVYKSIFIQTVEATAIEAPQQVNLMMIKSHPHVVKLKYYNINIILLAF